MSDLDKATKAIEANFEVFRSMCEKLGDRTAPVMKMLDELGDRIAMCPASSRTEYHNAFPGGLVEHSIRVLKNARKISQALGIDVPSESLIIAALFHDFGKVGSVEREKYLDQDSDWHRSKGMIYKVNPLDKIPNTGQGALCLLQHYGVKLSEDEYLAVLCNDGQYIPENKPFAMKEPDLALVIHHADIWATREEKKRARTSL